MDKGLSTKHKFDDYPYGPNTNSASSNVSSFEMRKRNSLRNANILISNPDVLAHLGKAYEKAEQYETIEKITPKASLLVQNFDMDQLDEIEELGQGVRVSHGNKFHDELEYTVPTSAQKRNQNSIRKFEGIQIITEDEAESQYTQEQNVSGVFGGMKNR